MIAVRQAVIFCGGLGTRLRPLTDRIPKPLAPVLGRPMLDYLLEQLAEVGLKQVLLLTGYRGEQIAQHVGDGSRFGLEVKCLQTPAEWETGQRLADAASLLDERFVLLYSDNLATFRLGALSEQHGASGLPVTVTVAAKSPGNIRLRDGLAEYDSTRASPGLTHVEIGYMMVEKTPVLACDAARGSFSLVLETLSKAGRLGAVECGSPYHSISDLSRLKQMEEYVRPRRLILLDRDGVVNRKAPRGEYVWRREDFVWLDDNLRGLEQLAQAGFEFILLSNQAGIGRGLFSRTEVDDLHHWMVDELATRKIPVKDVFICPHHWEDECDCRKPLPGLFFQANRRHPFRLERTIYIGDDARDITAAERAGCPCVIVGEDCPLPGDALPQPAHRSASVLTSVPWIVDRFERWEAAFAAGVGR